MPCSARARRRPLVTIVGVVLASSLTHSWRPAAAQPQDESPSESSDTAPATSSNAPSSTSQPAAELPLDGDFPEFDQPADRAPAPTDTKTTADGKTPELTVAEAAPAELFGRFAYDLQLYPTKPMTAVQPAQANQALLFEPGLVFPFNDSAAARSVLYVRLDEHDVERSHFDVREALLQLRWGPASLKLGINTVYWGVTESRHLVNIINQPDYLDDLDGDAKLGQLMALLSLTSDWGMLETYIMSWFRPQVYPSQLSRPGVPLPVLYDSASYESRLKRWNLDLAARWSHSVAAVDWALSYFFGTTREPELIPQLIAQGTTLSPALEPRYDLIHQAGLEFQWTVGQLLVKTEAIARSGQGPRFAAASGGFEYTFSGLIGPTDVGILAEYNYDGRDNLTFNPYERDAFGGVRISPNDEHDSQFLLGAISDVKSGVTAGTLETSRRFGQHWKAALKARAFFVPDERDPLYWFRRDHYVQTTLAYHF